MISKKTSRALPIREIGRAKSTAGNRVLAAEVPLALTYNGISHVVMMITPADFEDFALGFSLSEEIVKTPEEITSIKITETEKGFVAALKVPNQVVKTLLERERNLVGQTGCGLCGVAEIEDAVRAYPKISTKPVAGPRAVFSALDGLKARQELNRATAAVHGAAFCGPDGAVLDIREDVGRHNAFDKLIGALARKGTAFEAGFVVLTSRCSFELVQKALALKIPMLAAISAPTALAVDLARDHDLTLIALARSDSFQVYNDPFGIFGIKE